MSEAEIGREPIELVEFVLPRCINVYGQGLCTATGGPGAECYNTRATCQDPDNYRDTPDRHLTPTATAPAGFTFEVNETFGTNDNFFSVEVRFASEPLGIIWEIGNSTQGAYLGVEGSDLIFEICSNGAHTISVPVAQFIGRTVVLYGEIDFTASSASTMRLWSFDPVEFRLTELGEVNFTAGVSWTDDNEVSAHGIAGDSTVGCGRNAVNWNGGLETFYFNLSSVAPADMSDNFRQSLWIGRGVAGEPTDEAYILPCLQDLTTLGTSINIAAADDNREPLGRRATLDFSVNDFTHSDIGQDPYFSNRLFDPREQSTFWRKWFRRQKFGKTGARVNVFDGYAGQRLSEYRKRQYVLDRARWSEDRVSFSCRDELSRTEFSKARVPAVSTGLLSADMDNSQVTFSVLGDVTGDYPASGTVRIDKEIITYTGTSYDGTNDVTTFSGLTRATDGSETDEHDADELVQVCRRYTKADVASIVKEWLLDDSRIPGQLINVAEIESETDTWLGAYVLDSVLTVPTGVDRLLGRLSEEVGVYFFYDERTQQIRMNAIRAIDPSVDIDRLLTYEDDIIADSFKVEEKPKQRLNIINIYYSPIDFAGDLNSASNFRNGLSVVNGNFSAPEQYGNLIQSRDIYGIFITTEAQANQTSARMNIRFEDVPEYVEFLVDAKDRSLWVGDRIQISHPVLVGATGERVVKRWLIIEAEEIVPGHLVRYRAADITLDGTIYRITDNAIGNYTPALFAQYNAFVTDNNGLHSDGSEGARIV